jgi:hypothetical protein
MLGGWGQAAAQPWQSAEAWASAAVSSVGQYDLSPLEIPPDVESSFQIIPFLEDATEQQFMYRLSEVLFQRLPRLAKDRCLDNEPQPDRLARTWELAARLVLAAERRELQMKVLVCSAVTVTVVCYAYTILFGFDINFEARPCEGMYAPMAWTRRPWAYLCRWSDVLKYVNAILPVVTLALTVKLCLPTSLQHSKQAVWLRSAAREIVREIYRYRTGLGNYGTPLSRWMNSPATLTPQSDDFGTQSTHLTFDEFLARVAERTRLNTGIVVDSLLAPSASDVKSFQESMIGSTVPPARKAVDESAPSTPRSNSTHTPRSPMLMMEAGLGGMTTADREDGTCRMSHQDYVRFRLTGQRDHLMSKRDTMKCKYELYWAFIIVCTVGAAVFAVMRMNLTMLVCMASLTGAMVCCDLGDVPLRLKTTSAVVRVLDDYLEQWEELNDREQHSPAKLQALVDGVEEVILLEDPFYLDDHMSLRARNLYEGQLVEIPDETDSAAYPMSLPESCKRLVGPRTGAPPPGGRGSQPQALNLKALMA